MRHAPSHRNTWHGCSRLPHEEAGAGLGLELGAGLLAHLEGVLRREVTHPADLHRLLAVGSGDQAPEVELAVGALVGVACTESRGRARGFGIKKMGGLKARALHATAP